VSVVAAVNPIVRKANEATAILIFIFFSLAKFFDIFSKSTDGARYVLVRACNHKSHVGLKANENEKFHKPWPKAHS
jgi:hypothetical protein